MPHAAALVHHGGIGTTAQGLAAGLPQLVSPLAHDQFDNAARLQRLGVGRTLLPKAYQAPAVVEVLKTLLGSVEIAAHGRELASRMSQGNALDDACNAPESLMDRKDAVV